MVARVRQRLAGDLAFKGAFPTVLWYAGRNGAEKI